MNLRYYRCFLLLYDILILDQEPLMKISDYTNKCFVIQDLKNFKLDQHTYKLFKDITLEKSKQMEAKK